MCFGGKTFWWVGGSEGLWMISKRKRNWTKKRWFGNLRWVMQKAMRRVLFFFGGYFNSLAGQIWADRADVWDSKSEPKNMRIKSARVRIATPNFIRVLSDGRGHGWVSWKMPSRPGPEGYQVETHIASLASPGISTSSTTTSTSSAPVMSRVSTLMQQFFNQYS